MVKITICGGGNGAQALAAIAARNLGCAVDVYAPLADEAARLAAGVDAHDGLEVCGAVEARARPHCISADPLDVIPGSGMVVLVLPAFAHETILGQIAPYLDDGAWVGAIPARGGFDYCAARLLSSLGRADARLFGLQTLPWACRIQEYGQVVHVLGVKEAVDAASRPAAAIGALAPLLEAMLGLPVEPAASLLALTLANTGQLIHPGIMYGLFAHWDGTPFDAEGVALFYHGLNEEGARTLAGLDSDLQAIRRRLQQEQDLAAVRPLLEWLRRSYGAAIADPSTLHAAFVTNRAYAGLKAPVRELTPGRFVPDFGARYLAEDVPFGLAVSRAIAALAGVETPAMDRVIAWAGERLGKDYLGRDALQARIPQRYGLESLEALMAFTKEGEDNDC
ncbi:MAG TPA: NAD/NADP octopine/nopaline dehydrogenase family protein [Anaerolineae bacterium]|nr:NAD/NADP octopine/nopaline dehydrogenase family protein [Anaerolineae bacterium]